VNRARMRYLILALTVVAFSAPVPAMASLAAFVASRDGWALSSDTAASRDGRHCGAYSKIVAGPVAVGALMHVGTGHAAGAIRRGIEGFTSPPTVEDLRALQATAVRVAQGEPEAHRRFYRSVASPAGEFMAITIATMTDAGLLSVQFALSISPDLTPFVPVDAFSITHWTKDSRLRVQLAGNVEFFMAHVRTAFEPFMAPLRPLGVGGLTLEQAARLSRSAIEQAIAKTATAPPTQYPIGGQVETVVLASTGPTWLHRLPAILRDGHAALASCSRPRD
jgi:hypothetical protein